MAMEITNNYNNYAVNAIKNNGSTKESNVITSTVELKTSTPGVTKTEQIKTGYSNVNDYSKYLQGKYDYMNTGTTSMQGVPTTVSVSEAFLKKCMNERKAKEKKTAEEKAAKRRREKKAEEEKAAKRWAEKKEVTEAGRETGKYTVSATDTDIKAVTQKVIAASLGTSVPTGVSFDIKV